MSGHVKFGYTVGAKQVNLPVLITCDTEYGIAEQTVRIILLELETFDYRYRYNGSALRAYLSI